MLDLTNEINSMIDDSRMDEDKVLSLIHDMLVSAYKRKFGTDENVEVRFFPNGAGQENRCVELYSVKEVVEEEDWFDSVKQIPYDEAAELVDDVEVGDSLEIPVDPRTFEYSAVQSAKQRSQQVVKEYNTDKVYVDAKAMEGKLVIGEIKRQLRNGDYMVNLNLEGTDALFPVRGQSPRETYELSVISTSIFPAAKRKGMLVAYASLNLASFPKPGESTVFAIPSDSPMLAAM